MTTLGFSDFVIKLNHRAVLTGLLNAAGVGAELHGQALVAIDKLDKIGRDGVGNELVDRGVGEQAAQKLLETFQGEPSLGRVRALVEGQADATAGVDQLEQIVALGGGTAAGARLRFDPSLARGLSYYTGAIMEIAVPDLAGSLGGGGRYDGLIGMFSGENVPACGFSLGLERILVVMGERGMFPADVQKAAADVLVAIFDAAMIPEAMKLASELRSHGVRAELYPEPDKLGKQMKYAASKAIPFAAILGGDELARGEVTIKNLTSGEQVSLARAEVPAHLRRP